MSSGRLIESTAGRRFVKNFGVFREVQAEPGGAWVATAQSGATRELNSPKFVGRGAPLALRLRPRHLRKITGGLTPLFDGGVVRVTEERR